MRDKILNSKEAAEYLRICLKTFYTLLKKGEIKYKKVGYRYRILKSELDEYLRENKE